VDHAPHERGAAQAAIIARFLKPETDPLKILVVCDMLLTGFDAPIEQVMYLDSPLKEHTLLQAIARVNRTADGKTYGLVVDYWGVSEALQEALAIFAPTDVKGA
jgi:type I restriction enzyme R subunit